MLTSPLSFIVVYRCQLWCQGDALHHRKESKGTLWREEAGRKRLDFFLEESMPVSFVGGVLASSSHSCCPVWSHNSLRWSACSFPRTLHWSSSPEMLRLLSQPGNILAPENSRWETCFVDDVEIKRQHCLRWWWDWKEPVWDCPLSEMYQCLCNRCQEGALCVCKRTRMWHFAYLFYSGTHYLLTISWD